MSVDLKFIPSTFGGGWLIPVSSEAREAFTNQFGEEAAPLAPLGDEEGWIIEPRDMRDLMNDIRADGWDLLLP
ncbi:hypothetical protein HRJ34_15025 [Rhizorhabdus wittichii]|uniref:Uncharacterized protein n=1 Tax=Rhizorhabdus wittichii TaxID=160791 RepID=A0A975CZ46_9SPHN|nr:hypothetical protein [Rhizorhabdus wittichii]QTH19684.1 hypothetical protein HRJ34_15025 [Rhizorhabdus wittichii]